MASKRGASKDHATTTESEAVVPVKKQKTNDTADGAPAKEEQSTALAPKRVFDLPWWGRINTDNKPQKFVSRMMGEAKKIFILKEHDPEQKMLIFDEPVLPDLSRWTFLYKTESIDKDSKLHKQLKSHNLAGVRFEINVPDEFPMMPPNLRVVHPKLSGSYVFSGGAICFEALTPKGWVITMTLASLAVAVVALLADSDLPAQVTDVGDMKTLTVPGYTREAAAREAKQIASAHRGGSSWSQSIANMKK
ncbi:unnamed protein product [Amoebophrya sp. A120]|nr:unnamed protein product [Amoebophrya sp. A120]|eukprot:GSA120T00023804001.1